MNREILLDGTPTTAGTYHFTVKVQTPALDFMVKTYTITVKETILDMPLDQAVYDPSNHVIVGVRGNYLFQFDANGGLIKSKRFNVNPLGQSSITLDTLNHKLYVSSWNPSARGNFLDQNSAGVFRVNPSSLEVELIIDIKLFTGIGSGDFSCYYGGPHSIFYHDGVLYGSSYYVDGTAHQISFWRYTTATTAGVINNGLSGGVQAGSVDFCWIDDTAHSGDLYLGAINGSDYLFLAITPDFSTAFYPGTYPGRNYSGLGICTNTVNESLYVVTGTSRLIKTAMHDYIAQDANLVVPGVDPQPIRCRFNPADSLIYIPTVGENTVVVFNPLTDTVVATKTGFDSPIDMVFTDTKVFAVQQGLVGLKEVV